ncbi:barstar family protein [Streptomyces spinoverrucosus]|uniref:barstar family protein n=1 Tax=Streptomyces spinoverrucosus TaxID=284043 RepID=UPI0027DA1683|nr:barstar family protein [Streptomyces spinoverrucosus]
MNGTSFGDSAGIPFRLVDTGSGTVLLTAERILDFFVAPDDEPPHLVTFAGVHHVSPDRGKAEEAELQVVDHRGERIGKYYLGRVKAAYGEPPDVTGGRHPDVPYDFFGFTEEYPRAGEIWREWADDSPAERGEWARLPAEWHESWLHVVQTSWFTTGKRATRYEAAETVVVDGVGITGRAAFYCALGEAVNGPQGYFGSNLDALFDCLRTARAEGTAPFTLVWRDHSASRDALGADFFAQVLDVLDAGGVAVVAD